MRIRSADKGFIVEMGSVDNRDSYLKKVRLGRSNIEVTELCLGTLLVGRLQADLRPEETVLLFQKALELGINFIDTAHRYGTYDHIRLGLGRNIENVIIASKTDAKDLSEAKRQVEYCFKGLDRDLIDIFLLHQVPSFSDFESRKPVLEYLLDLKSKGRIRAVGLSTHTVEGNRVAAENPDLIDILHPVLNAKGLGITDGDLKAAVESIKDAHSKGIGVYVMKPLAGGHLRRDSINAFNYLRSLDFVDAIAVGMKYPEELEVNVAIFSDGSLKIDKDKLDSIADLPRRVFVNFMCVGCGSCISACHQGAISLVEESRSEGKRGIKAVIDEKKCIMCGYCAEKCPRFAIRVV